MCLPVEIYTTPEQYPFNSNLIYCQYDWKNKYIVDCRLIFCVSVHGGVFTMIVWDVRFLDFSANFGFDLALFLLILYTNKSGEKIMIINSEGTEIMYNYVFR